MTEAYALQIAAIAAIAGVVAMSWIWIASKRLDREIAQLKEKEAAEHALSQGAPR